MARRSLLVVFFLVWAASNAEATTRYISTTGGGTGDGSSATNALPFADGVGFNTALSASSAGDEIRFARGTYTMKAQMIVNKSGAPGHPITISGDGTDKDSWPNFVGTRQIPSSSSQSASQAGIHCFNLAANVSYITFTNLRADRFNRIISARNFNNHGITIVNIYGDWIRETIYSDGDADCLVGYICPNGSHDWVIDNLQADHVAKKLIRVDNGGHDWTISNCRANGNNLVDDFPIYYHFGGIGIAYNITVTNSTGTSGGEARPTDYDNGDCFATEAFTTNIAFDHDGCFDMLDSGFDLKGGPHTVTNAVSFRNGHFGFRFWNAVMATNIIAGFSKEGLLTQHATGGGNGRALQIGGYSVVDFMTDINNPGGGSSMADMNTFSFLYIGGTGATPTIGAIMTDSTSGFTARVAHYVGNATAGTLYVYANIQRVNYDTGTGSAPMASTVVTGATSGATAKIRAKNGNGVSGFLNISSPSGPFAIGEIVTTPSGFSATARSTGELTNGHVITDAGGFSATATGNPIEGCGFLLLSHSVIGRDMAHAVSGTNAGYECTGLPTVTETDVVRWVEGSSETDPQYGDVSKKFWIGDTNEFNSTLYMNTKGYYNAITEKIHPR